ncbi:protein amalgam isoform X1 [Drosophila grimshawi]|uniref:protein amalgam isoform X1 n=1 Tax=Drosophila grimshawi TaxID=7222 RepID=UPI000C86FC12|nr:protein amalgam isoform X1 [Drosophila grimshawi]XP_043072314.1 protein amalgam isoform X1 [Drosophila grimshawi]
MRAATWMLLSCLLIGLFYDEQCRATPIDEENSNDPEDDDYDYDNREEPSSSEGFPMAIEEHVAAPYFEKSNLTVSAKPGDDVTLTCDARNYRNNNVAMWYKNDVMLTSGQSVISTRVKIMPNNSLFLENVSSDDADVYKCQILPDKVEQYTTLSVGARLSILCDDRDVTDRSQTFKQGDNHKLECRTYLPDNAKIIWSFNGQRLQGDDNGVIVLENVDEENAGVYQCLGEDRSAAPPHGSVSVDVQFSPKASTHRHHVNTMEGDTAEIYCNYRANPIAISFFIKDGKKLTLSDKYSIRNSLHKEQNRTTLLIKHVEESDLGEYLCQVENTIGASDVRIQLSYHPETPQFENITIDGNKVTMHWLVRSLQPLSEAMLDYKLTGSYTWSTVSVIRTHRHDRDSGIWKITHQMELTPGHWHAHVKTKNTQGWSNFSPDHEFFIKDEEVSDEDEDSVPPDDLVRAGFGVGSSKANAACTMNILPSLMMMGAICSSVLLRL